MAAPVLLQTALLLLGLLLLVQGRLSRGFPRTVVTYVKMAPFLGQLPVPPLVRLVRQRPADIA